MVYNFKISREKILFWNLAARESQVSQPMDHTEAEIVLN